MAIPEVQWYDRNPKGHLINYDHELAPHTANTRVTYTCPAEKIAMVELLDVNIIRSEAATTVGIAMISWGYQAKGEIMGKIVVAKIVTNIVGDHAEHGIGVTLTMFPGEILSAVTSDNSVAGKVHYFLAAKITEFEAYEYKSAEFQDIQQPGPKPDPVM